MNIQKFAYSGLKRDIPELLPDKGMMLELGPGHSPYPSCTYLEYPNWDADTGPIPYPDNYFDVVHMYHFLEHVKDPRNVIYEAGRVIKTGGHVNIVVPHQKGELAYEDLDHKTFFNEETIPKTLFNNGYNTKTKEHSLQIHANFIMGVAFRNLCVFTQLIKVS